MKGKKIMKLTAIFLSVTSLLFGGCGIKGVVTPVKGGTVDKTDKNAPKTIESKDISTYFAHFYLEGEWTPGMESVFYTFKIEPDESGTLTVSEAETGLTAPADKELLTALQDIIDECGLARLNGEDCVTQGTPPGACSFEVKYESGEVLSFRHNNYSTEEWMRKTYLAFADWFAAKGDGTLLPPVFERTAIGVELIFTDKKSGSKMRYDILHDTSNEDNSILYRVHDDRSEKITIGDYEKFKEGINSVLSAYDLRMFDHRSAMCDRDLMYYDKDTKPELELVIWYDNDEQIYIKTSKEAGIDKLRPLIEDLSAFLETYK